MELTEVNSAALKDAFHKVPFMLYSGNADWVPYLKQDVEKLFDEKKNKLFAEGGKAIRWILKDADGKLIGRVAAFVNPRSLVKDQMQAGGMGFFDCINDERAAFMLFDACGKWLQEQGMEAMDGPVNFGDRQQFWGCQVTNWNEPPIYPMNYNPPYAAQLFEAYGFKIYFRQFVYWRDVHMPAQQVFQRKINLLQERNKLTVKNIRGMSLDKVAADFRTVYNAGWGGHSHFKPMSEEGAQKVIKAMKPVIDPDIILFVYDKDEPIAFYVNLPELNQIFRYVNGDLNMMGKLKFLWHKWRKTPTRMVGLVFGVSKAWQGKGVEAMMIVYAEKHFPIQTKYRDTVLSWIGDFNPKMIKVAENLGSVVWRTFHTYRYQFDRNAPFERAPIVD